VHVSIVLVTLDKQRQGEPQHNQQITKVDNPTHSKNDGMIFLLVPALLAEPAAPSVCD
jgi:hypothetical protein